MLTEEQLKLRRSGVGASEVGILAGVGFKSPLELYFEKIGIQTNNSLDNNELVYWGNKLEDVIADRYAEINCCELETSTTLVHPELPFILATPDRFIKGANKGLEIKTAGIAALKKWKDINGELTVPPSYVLQCHQAMLVTGLNQWSLAVLFCGQDLKVYEFEYDSDIEKYIIELCTTFWHNHVLPRVPPNVNFSDPKALDLVKLKYPKVEQTKIDMVDDSYLTEWLAAKKQVKIYQDKADRAQATLLEIMGEHEVADFPDGRRLKRSIIKMPERVQSSYEYVRLSYKEGKKDE